jgi:hypothetical protein
MLMIVMFHIVQFVMFIRIMFFNSVEFKVHQHSNYLCFSMSMFLSIFPSRGDLTIYPYSIYVSIVLA